MNRWFRHYAGMMRDEKLVAAAVKSRQPVERVIWIWGAILESASEVDDAGRYELDPAEAAYFLRTDEADICGILDALTNAGRIAMGRVVKWGDRQYQSDKSSERQARYRERKRSESRHGDEDLSKSDVTPQSRDGVVTPPDTEADTEKKEKPAVSPKSTRWPKGQKVPDDWLQWGREHFPAVEPFKLASQARQFEDYWPAKGGKDGLKLDWELTWRNWLRKAFPGAEVELGGATAADLVVLAEGDADFIAVERLRGRSIIVGSKGTATITKAELDQARKAAAA